MVCCRYAELLYTAHVAKTAAAEGTTTDASNGKKSVRRPVRCVVSVVTSGAPSLGPHATQPSTTQHFVTQQHNLNERSLQSYQQR
jgi:hypothetical protein